MHMLSSISIHRKGSGEEGTELMREFPLNCLPWVMPPLGGDVCHSVVKLEGTILIFSSMRGFCNQAIFNRRLCKV